MDAYQRSVNRFIENAASRIAPDMRSTDVSGRDRDDYRVLFQLKAWQAADKFQKTEDTPDGDQRWAYTAIRNQLRDCCRELSRLPEMARYDLETDARLDRDFEKRMIERDLIMKLRQQITSGEWDLLMDYLENGCNASAVWESYGRPGGKWGFLKRIRKLRERCREIIKKLSSSVPKSGQEAL